MKLYEIKITPLTDLGSREEAYPPFESDEESLWTADQFFGDLNQYVFPSDPGRNLIDVIIECKPLGDETLVIVSGVYADGEIEPVEYLTNLPID